jgi:hypothetical protein
MTSNLAGTQFDVVDLRGEKGFPEGPQGLVYIHQSAQRLPHRYTGTPRVVKTTWLIRTTCWDDGWRIDRQSFGPLFDCPRELSDTFTDPQVAAKALRDYLDSQTSWN